MPPRVAKEKIGTLLLASEMPVPIPRSRTVLLELGGDGYAFAGRRWRCHLSVSVSDSISFPALSLSLRPTPPFRRCIKEEEEEAVEESVEVTAGAGA